MSLDLTSTIVLGLTLGACVACGASGADDRRNATPLAVETLAPAYAARALNGDSVSFGGAPGAATLVNVWATWCTACKEEFTDLERYRADHEREGLRVVAVSVDQGGEDKVRRFAEAQGARFPVVHDREARISRAYGVLGLPSTYLIGRDGRVRWLLTGSFLAQRASLEDAMRRELASARGAQ